MEFFFIIGLGIFIWGVLRDSVPSNGAVDYVSRIGSAVHMNDDDYLKTFGSDISSSCENPMRISSIFSDDSYGSSTDEYTDPAYSWMPGNIFHTDDNLISSHIETADYITDPVYSFMPCNIFHSNDDWSGFSNSLLDDSCSGCGFSDDSFSSSCSSFDDDW